MSLSPKPRSKWKSGYRKFASDACVCCGSKEQLEWDHIIPRSKGGPDRLSNLQILCRPCNFSKGVSERCTINHSLDVMSQKQQIIQRDTSMPDEENISSKPSRARMVKGPNPQVNWRIEEDVKTEIEETAKRRGIGAGEVIKELWRSQHAETLVLLQKILAEVSRPRDDDGPMREVTSRPTTAMTPHMDHTSWPRQSDPWVPEMNRHEVPLAPVTRRRSWLRRAVVWLLWT